MKRLLDALTRRRHIDDLTPEEQMAEEVVTEVLDEMLLPLEVRRCIHVYLVGYLLIEEPGTIERLLDELPAFKPGKRWEPDPAMLEEAYDDVLRRCRLGLGGLLN